MKRLLIALSLSLAALSAPAQADPFCHAYASYIQTLVIARLNGVPAADMVTTPESRPYVVLIYSAPLADIQDPVQFAREVFTFCTIKRNATRPTVNW